MFRDSDEIKHQLRHQQQAKSKQFLDPLILYTRRIK